MKIHEAIVRGLHGEMKELLSYPFSVSMVPTGDSVYLTVDFSGRPITLLYSGPDNVTIQPCVEWLRCRRSIGTRFYEYDDQDLIETLLLDLVELVCWVSGPRNNMFRWKGGRSLAMIWGI